MVNKEFPKGFLWGTAAAAAQYEGAAQMDGRGLSIWDVFANTPGQILDGSNPSIADDFYHTYKEDIRRMKEIGIQSFRFSFAWSRVFPEGKGAINQKGLDFYKRLVEELSLIHISYSPWAW